MGAGHLAAVGVPVAGSWLRAFWAQVHTPGASSWACKVNSSCLRDRMCSSEESWRMPTVGLGDMPSKSALVVEVEARFWQCHLSRRSLKVLPGTVPGMKHPPGNVIWPSL